MSIEQENNDMLRNQIKEVAHHSKEIKGVVTKRTRVEPWVVAKMERASSDLSDVTHYLDGEKYADGGELQKTDKYSSGGKHTARWKRLAGICQPRKFSYECVIAYLVRHIVYPSAAYWIGFVGSKCLY